ncbi:MAG: glycosyltransferase [Nostoc sp.]|uniref:glycosyltransferase n=1 Tax=Nostoc sp. TaxID=1180 RepID=UPI002FF0D131
MSTNKENARALVFSLLPLKKTGGGENYTLNCAISISASGIECDLVSPCEREFVYDRSLGRFYRQFNITTIIGGNISYEKQESFREILSKVAYYDTVCIHQYLGNISIYDLILLTHSEQYVIFTNLGFEENAIDFWIRYNHLPNHFFIEISKYSADRFKKYTNNISYVYAGAWKKQLEKISTIRFTEKNKNKFVSVGRILPHKAFEVAIDAVGKNENLVLVGPYSENDYYKKYLNTKSSGKNVYLTGEILSSERDSIIASSIALIANSTSITYQSQKFENSELLGLVIIEALLNNTLPITSSQPALKEVMGVINLKDFVYTERDSKSLRKILKSVISLSEAEYIKFIEQAIKIVEDKFLWDNYWLRVEDEIAQVQYCSVKR